MINSNNSHHTMTIERVPITPAMKFTLNSYIAKQRQKKKDEEEQDAVLHRQRKILEIKRQQDTATLEQTNDQITQLESKLEDLKKDKHDLFARLKKVLNFEEEQRRKVQQLQFQHAREASEVLAKVGPMPTHLMLNTANSAAIVALTAKPPSTPVGSLAAPVKRQHSPSPQSTPTQTQATPSSVPPASQPSATKRPAASPTAGFTSPRQQVQPRLNNPQITPPQRPAAPAANPSLVFQQPQPTRLIDFRPFSSPLHYEMRGIAPMATHLPSRIPQHVPSTNMIPVLQPNSRQIGSLTSGFSLHRPPPHMGHALRMLHMPRPAPFQRKPYPTYPYHTRL